MAGIIINQTLAADPTEGSSNENYTVPLLSLAILYFMMGFITCLNDTLVPFFKKDFGLSYSGSSLVQFYFFVTYGIMSIPAGRIVQRLGYKQGMVLGFSIAALGALLFFPASIFHRYFLFLMALFVVAIGIVILQVAANPYITLLGPRQTASARLTLIQGVGSVGTTVAPLFGAYFILSGSSGTGGQGRVIQYVYIGIAGLLLLIAFVVSKLKLPVIGAAAPAAQDLPGTHRQHIFSFRNLNLGVLAIFFYVGAEVTVGTFLTNYTADTLHIQSAAANGFVAFYWGSMLLGRLAGSFLLRWLKPPLVLAASALAAGLLVLVSVNTGGYAAVWTMIAVGLFNSIMFAIIFSLSVEGLGKFTTQASGLLSTAIIGGAIVSYCQGWLLDHFSWRAAFMLPLVCYGYILFYGVSGHRVGSVNR